MSRANNQVSKRATLLVAAIASFLTPFAGSSVTIALPSIGKYFSMDAVLLGWVATSYILAAAALLVPFGRIADIYGRKKVFAVGIVVYTVSSLLAGFSTSATLLVSFRVLQGVGSAMIFGIAVAILTSAFPADERGQALGVNVAAVYLGLSLGPFLGGSLTEHLGWRSVFWVNVPLGLIIVGLVLWKLGGEWAEARGEKFDLVGSITYSLSLVAVIYGFSVLPSMLGIWLIILGTLGMLAFFYWEARTESPVLDINLFRRNPLFAFSNLAALINYTATFAIAFLLSLYLQYIRGLSPQSAGLILVAQPAVQAIFSPLAGRLSDKVEPRVIVSVGMALTFVGLCLLTQMSEETMLSFIIGSLILIGFGLALFSSPNTNAVMSSVENRFYGVASGTVGTMRMTGQMLSMGIVMIILAVYIGRVQITPEHYPLLVQSIKIAFTVFAALCFGGIFASLARGKMR